MKKRVFISGYAEGSKSLSEVRFNMVHGRHGTSREMQQAKEQNAVGGVEVHERRGPTFLKKNVGAVKDRRPYGSRKLRT